MSKKEAILKLKEKCIPDIKNLINDNNTFNIKSLRMDIFINYIKDIPLKNNDSLFDIQISDNVSCVFFDKQNNEYIWYLEIRNTIIDNKSYINMPWMFLRTNDIDYRWQWYMKEWMYSVIKFIKEFFPFFKYKRFYSWSSLSNDAKWFFNKLVRNWEAKFLWEEKIFSYILVNKKSKK